MPVAPSAMSAPATGVPIWEGVLLPTEGPPTLRSLRGVRVLVVSRQSAVPELPHLAG
jgi:hypothetical protein